MLALTLRRSRLRTRRPGAAVRRILRAVRRGRSAPVVVVGEQQVTAGGPGVGAVAQALAGERVEVLGEAGLLAQRPEPAADLVGEVGVAGAAQAVLDQH